MAQESDSDMKWQGTADSEIHKELSDFIDLMVRVSTGEIDEQEFVSILRPRRSQQNTSKAPEDHTIHIDPTERDTSRERKYGDLREVPSSRLQLSDFTEEIDSLFRGEPELNLTGEYGGPQTSTSEAPEEHISKKTKVHTNQTDPAKKNTLGKRKSDDFFEVPSIRLRRPRKKTPRRDEPSSASIIDESNSLVSHAKFEFSRPGDVPKNDCFECVSCGFTFANPWKFNDWIFNKQYCIWCADDSKSQEDSIVVCAKCYGPEHSIRSRLPVICNGLIRGAARSLYCTRCDMVRGQTLPDFHNGGIARATASASMLLSLGPGRLINSVSVALWHNKEYLLTDFQCEVLGQTMSTQPQTLFMCGNYGLPRLPNEYPESMGKVRKGWLPHLRCSGCEYDGLKETGSEPGEVEEERGRRETSRPAIPEIRVWSPSDD